MPDVTALVEQYGWVVGALIFFVILLVRPVAELVGAAISVVENRLDENAENHAARQSRQRAGSLRQAQLRKDLDECLEMRLVVETKLVSLKQEAESLAAARDAAHANRDLLIEQNGQLIKQVQILLVANSELQTTVKRLTARLDVS